MTLLIPWVGGDTTTGTRGFAFTITDTTLAATKKTGFAIMFFGTELRYRTASNPTQLIRFDTLLGGNITAVLQYFISRDSLTFEYHKVSGYNALTNQYIQKNVFLHTP